jgi:hypothetical protein
LPVWSATSGAAEKVLLSKGVITSTCCGSCRTESDLWRRLAKEGEKSCTVQGAIQALKAKIAAIQDLAVDLLSVFWKDSMTILNALQIITSQSKY